MKPFNCLLHLLMIAVLTGCSEDDSPIAGAEHSGVVTPVGAIAGDAETFEVGLDGGMFRSRDGRLAIEIPQGAVSTSAVIGIQMLENTAPHGVGHSYRLTPHDIQFQKPVDIIFYYDDEGVSFADGLAVAFQDADGIWYWPGNLAHDRDDHAVGVQTTHFSDWSLFESMILDPFESAILPGEDVRIAASRVLPEDFEKDLLAPLVNTEKIPLGSPQPLEAKYIGEWKLAGGGTLSPDGGEAVYVAPDQIPDQNPVSISLEVKLQNKSRSFLFAYVAVIGNEIKINGGPYVDAVFRDNETAMATFLESEGLMTFGFFAEGPIGEEIMVYVTYPGAKEGQEPWTEESCWVSTFHVINDDIYQGGHMLLSDPPSVHPGNVNVISYDEELGILTGTFNGDFTIVKACSPDPCISYGQIEGRFVAATK